MDIEFIVQDTFSLTRPQWKLAANLEEAAKAFQLAISQDQKNAGLDKSAEQDDASSDATFDDEGAEGDGDMILPEAEGDEEDGRNGGAGLAGDGFQVTPILKIARSVIACIAH